MEQLIKLLKLDEAQSEALKSYIDSNYISNEENKANMEELNQLKEEKVNAEKKAGKNALMEQLKGFNIDDKLIPLVLSHSGLEKAIEEDKVEEFKATYTEMGIIPTVSHEGYEPSNPPTSHNEVQGLNIKQIFNEI